MCIIKCFESPVVSRVIGHELDVHIVPGRGYILRQYLTTQRTMLPVLAMTS